MKPIVVFLLISTLSQLSVASTDVKPTISSQSKTSKLERAYQREYTFLLSQRRVLQAQFNGLKNERQDQVTALKKDIKKLEKSWIKVSIDSKYVQNKLSIIERNVDTLGFDSDRIDTTLKQSHHRLKEYHPELQPIIKDEEKLSAVKNIFRLSQQLLLSLSSSTKTEGVFFDTSGREHRGQIVKYGNIAGFAISKLAQGPITAVKGGGFKLIEETSEDLVKILAQKNVTIPFYLVESLSSEFIKSKEKTIADELRAGGAIGYVILALGAVAIILVGLRVLLLRRADADSDTIAQKVITELKEDRLSQATQLCFEGKSVVQRVLFDAVTNIHRERPMVEEVINESLLREGRLLNKFATMVLITAAVAPLLGLLGTVTGMIATFDVITEFGTGDPKMLSGGVSEALITTKFGLIVAIPAVVVGNLLSSWSKRIRSQVEQAALSIVNAVKG